MSESEIARRALEAMPEPPNCTCPKCESMCRRCACWPTPDEARKLIAAGYGDRLMLDHYYDPSVAVLMPAAPGCGGMKATEARKVGGCGMLVSGLCILHTQGLKPVDGRMAHHAIRNGFDFYRNIALTWDTPGAQELATYWIDHYMHKEES